MLQSMQVPNSDLNCCKVMGSQTTPLAAETERKMLKDEEC
jgi:hypothetical protein